MHDVLFIDPSIAALGWAVFRVDSWEERGKYRKSGNVKLRGGKKDWVSRLDKMVDLCIDLAVEYGVSEVVIEQPSVYSGGNGDVAGMSGSIMKLSSLVFALRQAVMSEGLSCALLPVRRWKGSLPKHITAARVKRRWGIVRSDHNEMDAIGMGDYWIRKALRYSATVAA